MVTNCRISLILRPGSLSTGRRIANAYSGTSVSLKSVTEWNRLKSVRLQAQHDQPRVVSSIHLPLDDFITFTFKNGACNEHTISVPALFWAPTSESHVWLNGVLFSASAFNEDAHRTGQNGPLPLLERESPGECASQTEQQNTMSCRVGLSTTDPYKKMKVVMARERLIPIGEDVGYRGKK